jgi:hypothetical protein
LVDLTSVVVLVVFIFTFVNRLPNLVAYFHIERPCRTLCCLDIHGLMAKLKLRD